MPAFRSWRRGRRLDLAVVTGSRTELTVALNLLAVRPRGGVGVEQFVRNVVGALVFDMDTPVTVALRRDCDPAAVLGERFFARHRGVRLSRWRVGPTPARILVEMLALSLRLFTNDVVLSINNFGPLLGKVGQRRIVVIHDVWFLSPVYTGPWLQKLWFRALLRIQLMRTDHVVTVSDFSRREIVARLKLRPDRVSVVPNCLASLDELRHRAEGERRQAHILLVGSDRANKNIPRALRAYAQLAEDDPGVPPLVVVGRYTDTFVDKLMATLGGDVRERIDFRGYVGRDELLQLMATSVGMAFPSLYEGYGIPVIEAIALGRPVLVSRDTVCAELAGPMGVVARGDDVASIRDGLVRLVNFDSRAVDAWRAQMLQRVGDCSGPARALSALFAPA